LNLRFNSYQCIFLWIAKKCDLPFKTSSSPPTIVGRCRRTRGPESGSGTVRFLVVVLFPGVPELSLDHDFRRENVISGCCCCKGGSIVRHGSSSEGIGFTFRWNIRCGRCQTSVICFLIRKRKSGGKKEKNEKMENKDKKYFENNLNWNIEKLVRDVEKYPIWQNNF